MSAPQRRLNVADAAEYAGKHPVTLRRALEAGDLHGAQRTVRGRWSVLTECLDAWLAGETCTHQRTTTARPARAAGARSRLTAVPS